MGGKKSKDLQVSLYHTNGYKGGECLPMSRGFNQGGSSENGIKRKSTNHDPSTSTSVRA